MWWREEVKQVQGIIKFCQDPCHAPWTVYLQLAIPAAKAPIITFLSFGLDDVFRGFFRPKGIYSFKRTGRRRGRKGGAKGIPELGDMIGSHLPGAEVVKARRFGNLTRWMWVIDGVLQRFLFWFMVVDLTTDFLYEWTSLIMKTEYCKAGRLTGAASCEVAPMVLSAPSEGQPLGCAYLFKKWGTFDGMSPANISAPASVYAASITVKALPLQNYGALSLWIAPIGQPTLKYGVSGDVFQDPDTMEATVTTHADLPGPGIYAAYARVTGPNVGWVTGGNLSGWAYT